MNARHCQNIRRSNSFFILVSCALLCAGPLAARAASLFTVTSASDSGDGTLRAAIASATNGDTINFALTTAAVITLTNGQLLITHNIDILGPGANLLAVDGHGASRVFYIASNAAVSISGLTISNGFHSTDAGGGIYNDHGGLVLYGVALSGNVATLGGGIYNNGRNGTAGLQIFNSILRDNRSSGNGGGIANDGTAGFVFMDMNTSTLTGNSATARGGALSIVGDSSNVQIASCIW